MRRSRALPILLAALGLFVGCARPAPVGRSPHPPDDHPPHAPNEHSPHALVVSVFADRGQGGRLEVVPPPSARVWLARVSPAPPREGVALPEAAADTLAPDFTPPLLVLDDRLKPPLLRSAPALTVPASLGRASVDLEVRVDEQGHVTDARWAGGSADSSAVAAASACARAMEFHPALQGGRPIAVWCRQRFDFGAR